MPEEDDGGAKADDVRVVGRTRVLTLGSIAKLSVGSAVGHRVGAAVDREDGTAVDREEGATVEELNVLTEALVGWEDRTPIVGWWDRVAVMDSLVREPAYGTSAQANGLECGDRL